jgi:glycosyltransferase involved in cell wall biosynthesis
MVRRVLHISNSPYASLAEAGPSYEIFKELAEGAEEYHVLAQHVRRAFSHDSSGKLHLHLVPALSGKTFALFAYRARRLIARFELDGVLCQDPVLGGAAGVHAARRHGVPVLVELHGDVYFRFLRSRNPALRAVGELARRVLCRATRVRVTGPALGRALEDAGVNPARMVHVPYRVKTRFFDPSGVDREAARERLGLADAVIVVSVGRFVKQKGYAELIEAFADVLREEPSARLVLAGGGPLEPEYRAAIARLGIEESIRLLGWVSREDERDLLGAADIYTQPSVPGEGEWMPRAILEAMSMGLPVVASSVGGIADAVRHDENGLLFSAGGEELPESLLALVVDAVRRRALGTEARRDAITLYEWNQSFELYRAALYSMDAPVTAG